MAHWAVLVPAERYAAERLFLHGTLEGAGRAGPWPATGEDVGLVAGAAEPVVFALGRVLAHPADESPDDPGSGGTATTLDIAYTNRLVDAPLPAHALGAAEGGRRAGAGAGARAAAVPIEADRFAAL